LENETLCQRYDKNKSVEACEKELGNMAFTASEINELRDIIKVIIGGVLDDLFN